MSQDQAAERAAIETTERITAIPHDNWDPQIENICKEIAKALRDAERRGLQRAAKLIPTTWLDPLLTGANSAVKGPPYTCPDIECLLDQLTQRILREAEHQASRPEGEETQHGS
jgi:hypothetical protein